MTKRFKPIHKLSAAMMLTVSMLTSQFFCPVTVLADKTTEQKLQEQQQEKAQKEQQLQETHGKIGTLEGSKTVLQGYLTGLNSDLAQVSNELNSIEGQLSDKEDEIEKTQGEIEDLEAEIEQLQKDLETATAEADEQYEVMKKRIKRLYEQNSMGPAQSLMGLKSFGEILNYAEYVERANEYDQNLLSNFKEKRDKIKEKKAKVEKDKADIEEKKKSQEEELSDIEDLKSDAAKEQNKVKGLVNQTVTQISGYSGQIAQAEADAKQYEAEIQAHNAAIQQLEAELARERALAEKSRQMAKKNLSQINVSDGERDLLACLIYCEAGSEPYKGQVAVGAVVMNRCMSGAFPDTITGVIYQSGQFAPVASGRLAARLAQGANESCYNAADEAMAGVNPVGDCLFFRTVIPEISGKIIGNHVFYNP